MVPVTVTVEVAAPAPGLAPGLAPGQGLAPAEVGVPLQAPPAVLPGGVQTSGGSEGRVLRVGDKVEVNYGNKGEYYPGAIDKVWVIAKLEECQGG